MSIQYRSDFKSIPMFYLPDDKNESISDSETSIFYSLSDKLDCRD